MDDPGNAFSFFDELNNKATSLFKGLLNKSKRVNGCFTNP